MVWENFPSLNTENGGENWKLKKIYGHQRLISYLALTQSKDFSEIDEKKSNQIKWKYHWVIVANREIHATLLLNVIHILLNGLTHKNQLRRDIPANENFSHDYTDSDERLNYSDDIYWKKLISLP